MTARELITELEKLDQDKDVVVKVEQDMPQSGLYDLEFSKYIQCDTAVALSLGGNEHSYQVSKHKTI